MWQGVMLTNDQRLGCCLNGLLDPACFSSDEWCSGSFFLVKVASKSGAWGSHMISRGLKCKASNVLFSTIRVVT